MQPVPTGCISAVLFLHTEKECPNVCTVLRVQGLVLNAGGHLTHRSNRVILENGKGTINNYTGIYGPPAEMAFGVWD